MAAPVSTTLFGETHMVNSPVNFTGAERKIRHPAREPGAQTDEVLASLGYSKKEIDELRASGVTQATAGAKPAKESVA